MYYTILAQAGMENKLIGQIFLYVASSVIFFLIWLYIFRAIFNIPSFLKYQRAQIRLLEEIAKNQGVDGKKVQSIISESIGWEGAKEQGTPQ